MSHPIMLGVTSFPDLRSTVKGKWKVTISTIVLFHWKEDYLTVNLIFVGVSGKTDLPLSFSTGLPNVKRVFTKR